MNNNQLQTVIQINMTIDQLKAVIKEVLQEVIATQQAEKKEAPAYYTRKEVAQILKVSAATIKNYERAGAIQKIDLPGANIRYSSKDVYRLKAIKGKCAQ